MAIYGDTSGDLVRREQGLDQNLTPDASGIDYGDSHRILGKARGGNDVLTGGHGASNELYGDAHQMYDGAIGGADSLTGGTGAGTNVLYGDAYQMLERSTGGNDTLTGGASAASFNSLYGDAFSMSGAASGGDDTLIGGAGSVNFLYGDAAEMSGRAAAGNDVLISGTGTDYMYGDAETISSSKVKTGADTFVFLQNSGNDVIEDFRQADGDKIDVSAYGFDDVAFFDTNIQAAGSDTLINFGGGNTLVLVGVSASQLTAADFVFQTV